MDNMELWNNMKDTPEDAKRAISGGRLNGFTDIKPMWRFRRLTEVFGPCGIGWVYAIKNQREVPGANGEVAVTVDIELTVKVGDSWSLPIPGTGGNMLVSTEKGKLVTNDEAYKMALSDAIGTACKALGMSEDIYMSGKGGRDSKYQQRGDNGQSQNTDRAKAAADTVMRFGPYAGRTLREIYNDRNGKAYLRELLADNDVPPEIRNAVRIMLGGVKNAGK